MSDGMTASRDAMIGESPARLARDYEQNETEGKRAAVGHKLHERDHNGKRVPRKVLRRLVIQPSSLQTRAGEDPSRANDWQPSIRRAHRYRATPWMSRTRFAAGARTRR